MKKLNLTKSKKITISVICVISAFIIFIIAYNTPTWNEDAELSASSFNFRGDKYTYVTNYANQLNFEKDKHIAHSGGLFLGYDYYSLKNDKNRDFIYVVVFRDRYIYSKVDVKYHDIIKPDFKYKDIISHKNENYLY